MTHRGDSDVSLPRVKLTGYVYREPGGLLVSHCRELGISTWTETAGEVEELTLRMIAGYFAAARARGAPAEVPSKSTRACQPDSISTNSLLMRWQKRPRERRLRFETLPPSCVASCADCRSLLERLRAWWREYETFEGRRYPKRTHVRAFIVKLHEEADALGIPFEEHYAAVMSRCVMTTQSAIHSAVRASESSHDRDGELARERAKATFERVVQVSRDGRGRIVRRQVPGESYKSWAVDLLGDFGWERQPATWDYLRNARSELRSKTDERTPAPWDPPRDELRSRSAAGPRTRGGSAKTTSKRRPR